MKLRHWHFIAGVAFACIVLLLFDRFDRTNRNSALTTEKYGALASLQTNIVSQRTVSNSQEADVSGIADGTLFVSRTNQTFRLFESVVPEIIYDRGLCKLEKPWYKTDAHEHARRYGTDGKVTLKIVDAAGNAVPGASVVSGFHITDDRTLTVRATSDANGMAELASPCSGEMFFSVIKDGHYSTRLRYLFSQQGYDCVKDGRWQPWNPTIEVVLKEKRRPIAMVVGGEIYSSRQIPNDTDVGYDFSAGDFIKPVGDGEHADIFFFLESQWESSLIHTNRLSLRTNQNGWFSIQRKDVFSEQPLLYEAPDIGDRTEVVYEYARTSDKVLFNTKPGLDDYLVFGIPAQASGNPNEKNFGTISELSFGGGWVKFKYTFNPIPGNRNLESETK